MVGKACTRTFFFWFKRLAGTPFLAASQTNLPLKVNGLLPGIVDEINLRLHFAHKFLYITCKSRDSLTNGIASERLTPILGCPKKAGKWFVNRLQHTYEWGILREPTHPNLLVTSWDI